VISGKEIRLAWIPMPLSHTTQKVIFLLTILIRIFPHRVIDGFDTLDDLEKLPVDEKSFRPKTEIKIRRVTIHANPLAD